MNDESKKKVEFYRKIGCATLYRYWLNIQKEVNKNEEISRKIEKNQTMINVNNYSGRLLLTVANGEIINSSSLSEDSFILKKDKINKLIEEPGILTVNEIIMINRSLQNRINDLLGVK
ncbi:IS630 transposase-related protein [Vibrio viridaestus]|uniref:IS630 transposase-related protein n=1 Tax=Vibrio viridaestus TaxID=2487322 RepID=UPI0014080FFE|nr:IS630 transposase-related protein [Vibrio viridaestus]